MDINMLQCCNTYRVHACAGLWRSRERALRLKGEKKGLLICNTSFNKKDWKQK